MRRILSLVLLGLGVFAIAVGLLLRFYAYPQVAKIPLDPDTKSEAEGSNVTAIEYVKQADGKSALPEIKTGLVLKATRVVEGDLTQPEVKDGGDIASWIEGVEIVDGSGNRVSATERQLCLDRHTNEAVKPCTKMYVQNKTAENFTPKRDSDEFQPGLSLKFPFATEQRGYQVYDINLRAAPEARFDGTDSIDGLEVYRFLQDIPATKLESRTVPGFLVGSTASSVEVDLYYQNRRTMWVEPVTGLIVKGQEVQHQELREPGEDSGTVVLDGTLTFTDQTVAGNVTTAKDKKSQLALVTTFPIYLWIGGGVVALLGLFLLLRPGGGRSVRHGNNSGKRQMADASR